MTSHMTRAEYLDFHVHHKGTTLTEPMGPADIAACEAILDETAARLRELGYADPSIEHAAWMICVWERLTDYSVDERGHETARDQCDPTLVELFDQAMHMRYGYPRLVGDAARKKWREENQKRAPQATAPQAIDINLLDPQIKNAIEDAIVRHRRLLDFGFTQDDNGQFIAEGCRVTFYEVMGEWEIDIVLPSGSAVGFDVAFNKVEGRTKQEIETAKLALLRDKQ